MEYGITENGFITKPFEQILLEQQESFRQIFGNDIDLSPESVAGAYCYNQSIKLTQLWEILGGLYAETDVGSAGGVYLDRLAAFLDVKRQDASPTRVPVALWGRLGTVIPKGNLVRSVTGNTFALEKETQLLQSGAAGIAIKIASANVGDEYKFTVDGVAIEYVAKDEIKEIVGGSDEIDVPEDIVYDFKGATQEWSVEGSVGTWGGLTIDATQGKLAVRPGNWAQFNNRTKIIVPVHGKCQITVNNYDTQYKVAGKAATLTNETSQYGGGEGEIEIMATGNSYIGSIEVKYETMAGTDGEEVVVREKDTKESVKQEIVRQLDEKLPGVFVVDPAENDVLKIHVADGSGSTSVTFDNFSTETLEIKQVATMGQYSCTTEGVVYVAQREVTQVVTNVSGLDTVINYATGTTGRNVETDDEFRVAIKSRQKNASGNEVAIQNAVEKVANVEYARVYSNRTMVVDGEGRPPKSFECVVINGKDGEIAEEIFNTAPAGIQPWGNTTVIVEDKENFPWEISFSRPEYSYAWVSIEYELNSEEVANSNIEESIKDAIIQWANENLKIGTDLIVQRLFIPIYSVVGLKDVDLKVCALPNNTTPGEQQYKFEDIRANDRTIIVMDKNRISVAKKEEE